MNKGIKSKYYNLKIKIFIILIINILLTILINPIIFANSEEEQEDYIFYQNILKEIEKENLVNANSILDANNSTEVSNKPEIKEPIINSRRYAIYDRSSKTLIYGKDENKQTAMASTTKIMTSLVILENCKDLNEVVTIDAKAAGTGGSTLGIKKGDKITVNDLLYGLMLRSGNDAAVALAEHIGRKYRRFCQYDE